ncbi:MAG: hypothetical protein KA275_05970, partial [Chitinophagaceae bacterium]|nr:hypothetical protein [Chitinophagaceae bacterium]
HSLYFNELVKKFKQGVNLQELHGKEKLDRWRAFYYAPPEHSELTDADRNPYLPQTDEAWAAYKEKENEYHNLFFAHEQWKEKIYTTTINNILLHFYPIIADFEGDYWLLYAMHLKDSYCKHKEYMHYIECNWDYDMPSSMLELSKEAYFEAFQSYAKDKRKQVEQKIRNRVLAWHELQKSAPTSQK